MKCEMVDVFPSWEEESAGEPIEEECQEEAVTRIEGLPCCEYHAIRCRIEELEESPL